MDYSLALKIAGGITTIYSLLAFIATLLARRQETERITSRQEALLGTQGLGTGEVNAVLETILKTDLPSTKKVELLEKILNWDAQRAASVLTQTDAKLANNKDLLSLVKIQLDHFLRRERSFLLIAALGAMVAIGGVIIPPIPPPPLPEGQSLEAVFKDNVPRDQWIELEKNLYLKAKQFPPSDSGLDKSPPVELITVFYEPAATESLGDKTPWELKAGFVKLQIIRFPKDARGQVFLRAYSSSSTGGSSPTYQHVYQFQGSAWQSNRDTPQLTEQHVATPFTLAGGDVIVVATSYAGQSIISSSWKEKEIGRDWHEVEVSDLITSRNAQVRYSFLTGSANYKYWIPWRYEVLPAGERLVFAGGGSLGSPDKPSVAGVFAQIKPFAEYLAANWKDSNQANQTYFRRVFGDLIDPTKMDAVKEWSGEVGIMANNDLLYITEWSH